MKRSALDYLACIKCSSSLVLKQVEKSLNCADNVEEIFTGSIACSNCGHIYKIVRGVPRFVDSQKSDAQNLETGRRFGESWKEFSRLDDRYFNQFFDWIAPVTPEFVKDKLVLEAGCGKGRHAQIMSIAGAAQVFAIDIGDAVDVAYQNVGHLRGVNIIQADIMSLPLKPQFDYAFSVGVLHHMVSPQDGFASMVSKLKPEGSASVWVYGAENNWWIINLVNPVRIAITSRLPKVMVKIISWLCTVPVFLGAKWLNGPWKNLQKKLPWLPNFFYQDYLAYIGQFDFTEIFNIVFDHLIAPVAYYIPGNEVRQWFADVNISNPILRWHNKNSWSAFGTRGKANYFQVQDQAIAQSGQLANSTR